MSNLLVTITAPTASGKSYLLNHIRKQGYPCLVSTTTRPRRANEVEGVDYYFISEAQSRASEAAGEFVETVTYNGVRYGVAKTEFVQKLSEGPVFLIIEPSAMDRYSAVSKSLGASHLKYFIYADMNTRLERMKKRLALDISLEFAHTPDVVESLVSVYVDRIKAMLTVEQEWFTQVEWTRVLSGKDAPEKNLQIIMTDARSTVEKDLEISAFLSKPSIK